MLGNGELSKPTPQIGMRGGIVGRQVFLDGVTQIGVLRACNKSVALRAGASLIAKCEN
jgi:hypothetical protein